MDRVRALSRLDAARRVHARRRADRAQGAGRRRSAAASRSSAPGRCCRWSRTSTRRPASSVVAALDVTPFGAKLAQTPGLLASAGDARERPLVHRPQSPARARRRATAFARSASRATAASKRCCWRDAAGARAPRRLRRGRRVVRPARGSAARRSRRLPLRFRRRRAAMAARAQRRTAARACRDIYLAGDGAAHRRRRRRRAAGPARRPSRVLAGPRPRRRSRAKSRASIAALARQAPLPPRARRRLSVSRPPARRGRRRRDRLPLRRHHAPARCAKRRATSARDASSTALKAFTRIGMGRCQGRVCGEAAAELLARACGSDRRARRRLRGQPPVKPIPIVAERRHERAPARRTSRSSAAASRAAPPRSRCARRA